MFCAYDWNIYYTWDVRIPHNTGVVIVVVENGIVKNPKDLAPVLDMCLSWNYTFRVYGEEFTRTKQWMVFKKNSVNAVAEEVVEAEQETKKEEVVVEEKNSVNAVTKEVVAEEKKEEKAPETVKLFQQPKKKRR